MRANVNVSSKAYENGYKVDQQLHPDDLESVRVNITAP